MKTFSKRILLSVKGQTFLEIMISKDDTRGDNHLIATVRGRLPLLPCLSHTVAWILDWYLGSVQQRKTHLVILRDYATV